MNVNSQDLQDFYNSVDNPFDIPVTENGLWEYPNQEVIVPTNGSITMKGVGYPVIGKSLETGEEKLMMPGEEYFFKNTKNVHETPKYQKGGVVNIVDRGGNRVVLNTDSEQYRRLYESRQIQGYDPKTDTYYLTPTKEKVVYNNTAKTSVEIPEIVLKGKKADWVKYKEDYIKNNPKEKYIQEYLDAYPWAHQSLTNYPKRLDESYENMVNNYIGEQIVKNKPQGNKSREDWLNSMTEQEQRFVQRNPKYGTTLWQDTVEGGKALFNLGNDLQISRIKNSDNYTNLEKKDLIQQHEENPILSNIGDVAQSLSFLTVPSKMVQSTLRPEYSFSDALHGTKNKASMVEDVLTDPLTYTGVGLVEGIGDDVLKQVSKAEKYLTTETPLKNAYKVNPWAFKPNPDAHYRQISTATTEGKKMFAIMNDKRIIQSPMQAYRTEAENMKNWIDDTVMPYKEKNILDVDGKEFPFQTSRLQSPSEFPFFQKGRPYYGHRRGTSDPNTILIESKPSFHDDMQFKPASIDKLFWGDNENILLKITGGKTVNIHPNGESIDKFNIYKPHWLKGYKPIEKFSNSNFKSEINWSKWNPEIPDNPQLMQEYNAIEQTSKANGTWMKNSDGSKFKGTPEQFVQQNSQNFKRAFGDTPNIAYRGQTHPTETIGGGNRGYAEGISYLGDKDQALTYAETWKHPKHSGKIYQPGVSDPNAPALYELMYPNSNNTKIITHSEPRNWQKLIDDDVASQMDETYLNFRGKSNKGEQFITTDDIGTYVDKNNLDHAYISNIMDYARKPSRKFFNLLPGKNVGNTVIMNSKPGNYLKSRWYNNGMFDMTNPNIYKTLVPGAIGLGALNSEDETPKYQDGGITDREAQVLKNTVNDDNDDLFYAQKGGSIDNENVKNFYNDMLNAPWYKERLNENGYMDSDNVISKRLKNINRIDFSVNNSVNTGYSQYKNLPSFLSNPNVTLNINESDYLNTPYNDSISHEYGHGETKGYDLSDFEKSLIEDSYINNSNDEQVNYLKSPYETKSDINAIRYHLYNMGKYNPKTGEYDTDSKLFEPSLLNNDLENTIIKRMKDAYGDNNLKKLMNTVADNNSKDTGYNA